MIPNELEYNSRSFVSLHHLDADMTELLLQCREHVAVPDEEAEWKPTARRQFNRSGKHLV